ncbi:MAG: hypothetical protein HYS27_27250 [Deltaproteobacteria bacterium]|nr:hypothetical protein [Deltaproteobacteria bacterium]
MPIRETTATPSRSTITTPRTLEPPNVRATPTRVSPTPPSSPPPSSVTGGPVRGAPTTRVVGTVIAEGVALVGGRLEVDGQPACSRALLKRSGGLALMHAAVRVADQGGLERLSASQRAGLVAELLPVLETQGAGRTSLLDARAHSGAFSLLEQVLVAMRGAGEERAATALTHRLLAAAARERHPGLRVHMERRIVELPGRVVGREDRAVVELLAKAHGHELPPKDTWLRGTPPTLKVVASVQDEFWKAELASYKKSGFTIEAKGAHRALAVKTISDLTPPVRIEAELWCRDTEVLDSLAEHDTDVVIYTGHANLGGVAKTSIEHGPRTADGTKLVAFLACRSKQNLAQLERAYPGQHLLVSNEGTYGHDDAMLTQTLLEGIVRGKSYAQIEAAAEKQGLWEKRNYHFPHETADMVAASPVYAPTAHTAQGRSISMRPATNPAPAATLDAGPVDDAIAYVNTIHGYWSEQSGTAQDRALHDRIAADGFFDGTAADPVIRVRWETKDGKRAMRVSVNSAYANQDHDALGMMVTYAVGLELAAVDPRRAEPERRMLALSMVGSYVYFLVEYSDVADLLLRQFANRHGFPPGLSWPVVEKSVRADMHNDCSSVTLDLLQRGMQHQFLEVNPARTSTQFRRYVGAALDVLRTSDSKIARLTWEMVATGRVQLDELRDLTHADYLRARKDLLKDGVKLPERPNAAAFRAITSDLNGYMWDDRIYLTPGLSPKDLAATIVHEVNHVLNKSEEHYRTDQQILVEEYRAFYAERVFTGQPLSAAACRALKERVIADYGLKGVTPADVADVPPGILDRNG